MTITRQLWVVLHRWAGLTLALFLAVAGFTGIFLAWNEELDRASAPAMRYAAPPSPGAPMLSALQIRHIVMARHPGAEVSFLPLAVTPGRAYTVSLSWHDPKTGENMASPPDWNEVFVDPYTGRELGRRTWGEISQGAQNLMPFVYLLHYQFALGPWGTFAFGIAALIWTLDCFVGFYLTLPVRQKRPSAGSPPRNGATWWQRWKPSWAVRWRASAYKLNFDLHRAGGLWIWPLLLVFAWSSVAFNLPQVYEPVMRVFGGESRSAAYKAALLPKPREHPRIGFDAALPLAEKLAAAEMARRGIALRHGEDDYLWHAPAIGAYIYAFTSSADFTTRGGGTTLAFDSDTGLVKYIDLPAGANGPDTFTNWLTGLHMAKVFGLPWRIAVSLIGALVTMLSVTGIVIWMKKRSGRIARQGKKRPVTA